MPTASEARSVAALAAEGATLMRYLTGTDPARALVDRYVRANDTLLGDGGSPRDRAVLAFALDHRWALPLLDGATGLVDPHARLRRKLLVAAAVLEASTDHVDLFMPGYTPPVETIAKVGFWGVEAVAKAVLGVPLLVVVRWRAR